MTLIGRQEVNGKVRNYKVHIFWEGHEILRSLHLTFHWHYIGRSKVKTSQDFVAFSEYMNFKPQPSRWRHRCQRCCLGGGNGRNEWTAKAQLKLTLILQYSGQIYVMWSDGLTQLSKHVYRIVFKRDHSIKLSKWFESRHVFEHQKYIFLNCFLRSSRVLNFDISYTF